MFTRAVLALVALGLATADAVAVNKPACGLNHPPCRGKTMCMPNSPSCTDLARCQGTCLPYNEYPRCGGHSANPPRCPRGSTCKDDPRIPNNCGMACDRPGICIPDNARSCGGFAGLQCPSGLSCFDAPNDGCDPNNGGADCIGVCL